MSGRNLYSASALRGIGVIICYYNQLPANQRQYSVFSHQLFITFVIWVNCDGGIPQHSLGPSGGDGNKSAAIRQGILDVPQFTGDLSLLHLQIRDGCLLLRVPIDQAFFLVNQALFVQSYKDFDDRLRQPLIHGETFP